MVHRTLCLADVGTELFVGFLLGGSACHHLVALQSVLGHHVVGQLCTLVCGLGELRHLLKHRLEESPGKLGALGLVRRRKAVLAKVGILIACHLFDIRLAIALGFEYRVHGFFQSEHTVLQCLLRLVHAARHTPLVGVPRHRLVILLAVAVAEHDVVVCNIIV